MGCTLAAARAAASATSPMRCGNARIRTRTADFAHRVCVFADSPDRSASRIATSSIEQRRSSHEHHRSTGRAAGRANRLKTRALGTGPERRCSRSYSAIVIIVWPSISLFALVILFGAFALARGIVGLGMAIWGPIKEGRGWLVLSSLAGIGIGVVVFFFTDMSALALLYVIGAYALTLGILTVFGALLAPAPRTVTRPSRPQRARLGRLRRPDVREARATARSCCSPSSRPIRWSSGSPS